jgi:Rab5 GDP/GTP exchange factor
MGAVHFIETMDHSGLSNITAEEFERNVEFAIHNLPSSPQPSSPSQFHPATSSRPHTPSRLDLQSPVPSTRSYIETRLPTSPHAGEESAQPLSLSLGNVGSGAGAIADDTRKFLQRTGDALGKPLSALGRLLGEALDGLDNGQDNTGEGSRPQNFRSTRPTERTERTTSSLPSTPYKPRIRQNPSLRRRGSPTYGDSEGAGSGRDTPDSSGFLTPSRSAPIYAQGGSPNMSFGSPIPPHLGSEETYGISRTPTPALDLAGVQDEIDLAHARASDANLGTLMQIFPGVEQEIIEWVLEAEGGDLGRSIEKLLEVGGEA